MKKRFNYILIAILACITAMPAMAQKPTSNYTSTGGAVYVIEDDEDGYSSSANATINNLREQLRQKDEQIDRYLKKLISIASNFLYLPYEKYSINDVAIPAFETAKGTEYYDKYQIRLTLLKNYRSDIDAISKFLSTHQNEAKKNEYDLSYWASSLRSEFNSLPTVQSYRQYGEGWDETFLGKIIYGIQDQLSNVGGDGAAQRIDSKFSNYLRQLR